MNAIKISVWEELRVSRNKPTGSLNRAMGLVVVRPVSASSWSPS
jgi:hypothetical protein